MAVFFGAKYMQWRCHSNKITIVLLHQKECHDLLAVIVTAVLVMRQQDPTL